MASPQIENGYIRIASEIQDALCSFRIPGECRQIFDCIIRLTYGYGKKDDQISFSQFVKMTGMKKQNVNRSLVKLIENKLVVKSNDKYSINKNYDEWISFVTSSKVITGKKNKLSSKEITKLSKVITPVIQSDDKSSSKVINTIDSIDNLKKLSKDTLTKVNGETALAIPETFGREDINNVSKYFLEKMAIPKEDCTQKQSRQYWSLLLKESKTGEEGVRWLIDLAAGDKFYRNHITSSKDLYYKRMKLVASKRGNIPRVAVMK